MKEIKLIRKQDTPILEPNKNNEWESAAVYNVGAIKEDGIIHMFYRATDKNSNGRECDDYMNYIGYATSEDGINFKREQNPILGPGSGMESRGCEDPRILKLENKYYMLYTAFRGDDFRIAIRESDDLKTWNYKGILLDEKNKDASFFPQKINGRYALLHRRPPNIWYAESDDLKTWDNHETIAVKNDDNDWESAKIGINGPPIEFDDFYLLFYHGVSASTNTYSLGLMLLDKKDPKKVLYRQKTPILKPELEWEKVGFVPNVVFSNGHVIHNDEILVYYGGADTVTGVAGVMVSEIEALYQEYKKESIKGN